MKIRKVISLLGLWPFTLAAETNFFQQHALGWHWYEKPPPLPATALFSQTESNNPRQAMHALQKQVERTLDQAILNPTPEHVRAYMALQNAISQQASRFAEAWRWQLRVAPQLDYSLTHPVNQLAKEADIDTAWQQAEKHLKKVAQHYGFVFFFKGGCPYCQRFAPIVKGFAARVGLTLMPIALDTQGLPEFPQAKQDKGMALWLHVDRVPALFAMAPQRQHIIPISYGLLSEMDLLQRLLQLPLKEAK